MPADSENKDDKASDQMSEATDDSEDLTRRIVLHVYDDESKEFTSLTTYHGMIRIYSSATWPSRIFWSLVVVTCLTLFMIHSGLMLFFYHSRPTFLKTLDSAVEIIDLPAITICRIPNYAVGSSQSQEHRKYSSSGYLLGMKKPACLDMVHSIRVDGYLLKDACSLFNVTLTELGYCLKLESWENLWLDPNGSVDIFNKVTKPLEIVLNNRNDKILFEIHARNGTSDILSKGHYIRRGTFNSVTVEATHQNLLDRSDWGTCRSTAFEDGSVYSQIQCERACKTENYIANCQCAPFYSESKNVRTCDPAELITCLRNQTIQCDCPVDCYSTYFEITAVTHMKWKNRRNSTKLLLNFQEKKKEVTQLKRIKAVDLLSFVAGSMGLFLGMSCVTLLEIFIYLFKSIWGALNDERHKQYFENLIGSTMDDAKEEVKRSYEQIVITTKVHGDEIEGTPLEQVPRGSVIEENYAISRNAQTRRSSVYRMGPRLSVQESRDGSEHEGSQDGAGGLRIQLLRPAGVRRKSVYQGFGNF